MLITEQLIDCKYPLQGLADLWRQVSRRRRFCGVAPNSFRIIITGCSKISCHYGTCHKSIFWHTGALSVQINLLVFVFISKPQKCLHRIFRNTSYSSVHLHWKIKVQNWSNLISGTQCGQSSDSKSFHPAFLYVTRPCMCLNSTSNSIKQSICIYTMFDAVWIRLPTAS